VAGDQDRGASGGLTPPRGRIGLGAFLVLCLVGLALVLGSLYWTLYGGARRTVLAASQRLMQEVSRRATDQVQDHLAEAERVLAAVETPLMLTENHEPDAIHAILLAGLGRSLEVAQVAFTRAFAAGVYARNEAGHDAGELRLQADSSMQQTVERDSAGQIVASHTVRVGATSGYQRHQSVLRLPGTPKEEGGSGWRPADDPTLHPTFTVPSRPDQRGHLLWSDLAYAEADQQLPVEQRRVVVSVQKAVWLGEKFLGVIKVALLSDRIDRLLQLRVESASAEVDPHRIFISDRTGRLVARLSKHDRAESVDDTGRPSRNGDLRVISTDVPNGIFATQKNFAAIVPPAGQARLSRIDDPDAPDGPYLAYLAALPDTRTQSWVVGVVVPESHHLAKLAAAGRRSALLAAGLMLLGILAAGFALGALRGDLGRVTAQTLRLRRFEFAATPPGRSTFREVASVLDGLEQAKNALRALGKYAPLDLVKQLFDARLEPTLGGEPRDVTILFTDIEGFTTLSEQLPQKLLAQALGAYLEALTGAVHAAGGVIDKYTGDGVMALFNAPGSLPDHPARACAAALAALDAATALFASAAWRDKNLPNFGTRIGVHRAEVSVGHFGAPDRMSYTAMGDGVNLAARLEGLNKQYGTKIMVSATVVAAARDRFSFRALGTASVKGKAQTVEVFELLGPASPPG
jgi:adenylate cyclase